MNEKTRVWFHVLCLTRGVPVLEWKDDSFLGDNTKDVSASLYIFLRHKCSLARPILLNATEACRLGGGKHGIVG